MCERNEGTFNGGKKCLTYTTQKPGSMETQHATMTRTRNFVTTVCLAVHWTATSMNATELADACAIEPNVSVWEDRPEFEYKSYYSFTPE